MCLGTTLVSAGRALRMSWNGVGLAKLNTAVRSSGVSTASRSLNTTRPRFCSGFQTCSAEKATSAEVNGLPSCQLTPSRSLKVTDRPSAEPSQLVASRGASPSLPSNEASASGSTTLLAMKNTPLEATIAGLRLRGSESAATTSRPPFFGVCAQPDVGMAVEASSKAEPASSVRLEIVKPDMIELRPLRDPTGRANPLECRRSPASLRSRLWALPRVSPETELAHPCLALKFSSAGPVWRGGSIRSIW